MGLEPRLHRSGSPWDALTDTGGAPLVCSLGSGSKTTIWEQKEGSWGVLEKPRSVVGVK